MQTQIIEAFKVYDKWHFLNDNVNGHNVQLKMYVGKKETDVQIFKIDGLHVNLGFNYANKTKTKAAIIDIVQKLEYSK